MYLIRKIKANMIRLGVYTPRWLLLLCYLSKLSQWVRETPMPEFNDFYSRHHDYDKRYTLYEYVKQSEDLDKICYMEFGVSQGHSFKWWVDHAGDAGARFVGFDTFTGLPEDWGFFKQGAMTTDGEVPDIEDARCQFVKGLFQDTLPAFLREFSSDLRKVIHLDADVYSSTLFVLTTIAPQLKEGDILMFDEFNVPLHEFRAFSDFMGAYNFKVRVLAAVNNYYQVCFKVESTGGK